MAWSGEHLIKSALRDTSFDKARAFAAEVADFTGVEVEVYDERFTTTEAERVLLEAGTRRSRRREVRDKLAATVLLQGYLDAAR